jgi:glutathione S-transferase
VLFREEVALPHALVPSDARKREHFSSAFLASNPNAKTPALVDGDAVVFDSNALLLHLAEQRGKFLREKEPSARAALLHRLMFVARVVPFILGENAGAELAHLKRLFDDISARPAAVRANALKNRHAFKTEMDEEACRNMFPQNVTNAA